MATYTGTAGNDTYNGGSGNDFIYGLGGNDTLYGGNGTDWIEGGNDADSLYGDAGSDTIYGGSGNDYIEGDQIDISINNEADDLYGESGNDTIKGGAHADFIDGGADDDNLDGEAGSDSLYGGAGNDTLTSGAYMVGGDGNDLMDADDEGADYYFDSGFGNDTIADSSGVDTIDLSFTANAITLNLTSDTSLTESIGNVINFTAGSIENFIAGSGNDNITGNSSDNYLYGGSGYNTLDGGSGNDIFEVYDLSGYYSTLIGGLGDDVFYVNSSSTTITEYSNEGNDTVYTSINGNYTLGANLENVILNTFPGWSLTGNALDNIIIGNNNANTLMGEDGADYLYGEGGDDSLEGGDGDDTLEGGGGTDTFRGGLGNDYYYSGTGEAANIFEDADEGIDTVELSSGSIGAYTLADNVENIIRMATAGASTRGNASDNQIYGNDGEDSLYGGFGNDYLFGGADNDLLIGGSDSDTLDGGAASDTLSGNTGDDHYYLNTDLDIVNEDSGEGIDTVYISFSANYTLASNVENLIKISSSSAEYTGNSLANLMQGGDGNDTLDGAGGADTLIGGVGNDRLEGGSNSDRYEGYTGNFGADIILDSAGGGDILELSNFALSSVVSWTAVDGGDSGSQVDRLVINFGSGNQITILNYFDNTTTDDDTSSEGSGYIETIIFSDDASVDFAQVQGLIA